MPETRERSTLIGPALDGVGYLLSAPARLPVFRTLLKEAIKAGLRTGRTIQSMAAEQGRQWQQLVAEAEQETLEARTSPERGPMAPTRTEEESAELEATAGMVDESALEEDLEEEEEDGLEALEGMDADTAALLRKAGIRSPRTLARRNPEKLRAKLEEVNEEEGIVSEVPSVEQIRKWIEST